jgi:hypothetical protein
VGQKINLSATVTGGTPSNIQWTIPSTAVKDFVVSADNTQGGATAVDGLNTSSVSFAWVDGGGANLEDFVTKEVVFRATVNGQQVEKRATFNVKRPVVNLETITTQTSILPNSNGTQDLIFATDIDDGITFRNTTSPMFPSSFSGTTQWVQIVNHSDCLGSDESGIS